MNLPRAHERREIKFGIAVTSALKQICGPNMRPTIPVGFRVGWVAFVLFFGTIAPAAEQHPLLGATREQVLNRNGEPRSTLEAGNRELLFYPRERIVLRDGVVVEVERLAVGPARRSEPAPEPAPTAETAAPGSAEAPVAGADAATEPRVEPAPGASEAPPPPPPEPRLEIKRVLPPGSATSSPSPRPAAPKSAPAPAPKQPSEPAPVATGGPAAGPATGAATAPVPTDLPSPAATSPKAEQASATATPATTSAAAPTPPADVSPTAAAETIKEEADAKSAAEAAAAKAATQKALETKAARRRLDEAANAAVDPTAVVFTTRTYVIAFLIIGGGIGYLVWRSRKRKLELAATAVSRTPFNAPVASGSGMVFSVDMLARLDAKRFEELVAAYYSKTGVVATRTQGGPEAPVHIKISWKGEPRPFALVQCIAQPAGLIDPKPIQALFAVLTAEDIRRGYVVTTGKFNVSARDFAEEKHITLLPGDIFVEKLNALPDAARTELMQEITRGEGGPPSCPICDAKMVRSHDEATMWRCPAHPEQTIPVRR